MKIKESKYGVERLFTFSELTNSYPRNVSISDDGSNCKLSYIHQAGSINGILKKEKKEVIDYLLKHCKGCVILNTIQESVYDFLRETYKVYYAHKVPIGYHDKFQYHVCIKNDVVVNEYCKDPLVEKIAKGEVDKIAIKKQLNKILKSKRRKNDYVDEFIESL